MVLLKFKSQKHSVKVDIDNFGLNLLLNSNILLKNN